MPLQGIFWPQCHPLGAGATTTAEGAEGVAGNSPSVFCPASQPDGWKILEDGIKLKFK